MSVIFDNHCHCFPPLGEPGEIEAARLAEHQYHVRFHGQGVTRKRDNVRIEEHILAGEQDGISWQPDVNFRIGKFGKLEYTKNGEEYYTQWMPPTLPDLSSSAEYMVAQMDYVGVDRAVLQHDRIYGKLDSFLGECVRRYPDRFVAAAQVDEWVGGRPDQLDRLKREVEEFGFRTLYFSTGGFFHVDFNMEVNDPSLDPLWDLVQDLGISIHWYAGKLRGFSGEDHIDELRNFIQWAEAHPDIPSILTHALATIHLNKDKPGRFTIPEELFTLMNFPNWHMELMLHLMAHDIEFPPYEPNLQKIVAQLVEEVGADRLVWGSDMPACERTVTYKQSMILFQTQCDFLTNEQRDLIMGGNLSRLYPLE